MSTGSAPAHDWCLQGNALPFCNQCLSEVIQPRSMMTIYSTMRLECRKSDSDGMTDIPYFFRSTAISTDRCASAGAMPSNR
jgi:hypothetical protein